MAEPDTAAGAARRNPSSPPRAPLHRRLLDWVVMREAVNRARAEEVATASDRAVMLRSALAYADAADTVFEADDQAPLAPVLTLYRQAMFLLLARDYTDRRRLVIAFETAPESILADAAHGEVNFARLHHALALHASLALGDAAAPELRDCAQFTRTSVRAMLDRAHISKLRQVLRRRRQRVEVFAAALLVVLLSAIGLSLRFFVPTDLADGRPWRASSALAAAYSAKMLFHTNEEVSPWFEIDLGDVKPVRSLYVKNRADCCQERAIPLAAEVSSDRSNWQQVARTDSPFLLWEPYFRAVDARFVRLRVLRPTSFHLEQVKVF